jgi:hypothetical protein
MASTGPIDSPGVEYFPARWIDIDAGADAAHDDVRSAMLRHHYKPQGALVDGVALYRFGSPAAEFLSDTLSLGLVLNLLKRPDGWAELAAWTAPAARGVRVTISLTHGVSHRRAVRSMLDEIVERFRAAGTLIGASEHFSSHDLPAGSPGRPRP